VVRAQVGVLIAFRATGASVTWYRRGMGRGLLRPALVLVLVGGFAASGTVQAMAGSPSVRALAAGSPDAATAGQSKALGIPDAAVANGQVASVSCPSRDSCTAVGSYPTATGGGGMFASVWNGTRWATRPVPNPRGAVFTDLSAVSCPTRDACTAVGDYRTKSGVRLLAEVWNGTRWSFQPISNPPGSEKSVLQAVSCPTRTICTAIGTDLTMTGGFAMFAERWNGTQWTRQPVPSPSGTTAPELHAVSCPTRTACTAVGEYSGASGPVMLAEAWNGTRWRRQPIPIPPGATASSLVSVSCPSRSACTAVGMDNTKSGSTTTLVQAWNGKRWNRQPSPNQPGTTDSFLLAVSCPSRTACMAVGAHATASHSIAPLAVSWNGTRWVRRSTPNLSGTSGGELNQLACPSRKACIAVGLYFDKSTGIGATLAEAWNGRRWVRQLTHP